MKWFRAMIEDDNFEIVLAENEYEVLHILEMEGHTVLEICEMGGECEIYDFTESKK